MPSHTHAVTDPGHAHGVNDPGHSHGVNDPGHSHGVNDPGHSHTTTYNYVASGDPSGALAGLATGGSFGRTGQDSTMSTGFTGISIQAAGTGISIIASGTGISIQSALTGISVGNAAHSIMQPYLVTQKIIKE
jgi:hypothetical protein